jgi:hypothetical protein
LRKFELDRPDHTLVHHAGGDVAEAGELLWSVYGWRDEQFIMLPSEDLGGGGSLSFIHALGPIFQGFPAVVEALVVAAVLRVRKKQGLVENSPATGGFLDPGDDRFVGEALR